MIKSAFSLFDRGRFLELGCGTGSQVIYAQSLGFDLSTGIDIGKTRIDIANKRAIYYKCNSTSLTFMCENFWNLSLNNTYTSVYSMFAFELFGNNPKQLSEKLSSLCSSNAKVILDVGRIKKNFDMYKTICSYMREYGFHCYFEPLVPFFVNNKLIKPLSNSGACKYFRSMRMIFIRRM